MQSAERYTTALSNAVAAWVGLGSWFNVALITPGHQEPLSSKVSHWGVPSASKAVARPAGSNVCESVTRILGWMALPTFQGAVCYGAVCWPGHGRHPNTLGNDCSRLEAYNGGAAWLKVEVDKNWGEDNQGEAVNRRHRHWRPWSSLPLRSFFHWRQQVIKWRVLMTSLAEECILTVLQKLVKATSNNV